MIERGDYPSEAELALIENWDVLQKGIKGLVEFVRSIWWMPDWGFKLYRSRDSLFNKRVRKLQLHTGGWSGNEDIINALRSNRPFWMFFWVEHRRGGHYIFEFPREHWAKKRGKRWS